MKTSRNSCEYVVGFVSCGSRTEARKLAQAVLTTKAAACVNILSGVESHYWWQGRLERSPEWLLLIKTTERKAKQVTELIQKNHSYEVPEIVFVRIKAGERKYLRWIEEVVR